MPAFQPPKPSRKGVDRIKSSLLNPALTSHFDVFIGLPAALPAYLRQNGLDYNSVVQDQIQLSCTEASLPGSSLATHEINGDFTGVTERHAYRRIYDDRIDLTFYVDAKDYLTLRLFETWIKFIVNESIAENADGPSGVASPNYFYRMRYPSEYYASQFSITKYERSYGNDLVYNFVNAYPISVSSIPVSYDSSSLLKCTVSLTYIRYYINSLVTPTATTKQNVNSPGNPELTGFDLASQGVNLLGSSPQSLEGGLEGDEIINAVNSNNRRVEAGLPYVGRNVGPLAP
jgi:hypothetical protein